ncbi:hypothetical protein EV182_001610 [Spiromyces aspiralis]|uniref:Uncharacterized protein n=1 Tax=Spiromyces aspiralis TaxID=68401 RepID=A0ACC1HIR5_9FUNG|nr:hypothetical protein EV182_001610 [Spiromyces aspiralis]
MLFKSLRLALCAAFGLLGLGILAAPYPKANGYPLAEAHTYPLVDCMANSDSESGSITSDQLKAAFPSHRCDVSAANRECATLDEAAAGFNYAFNKYNITRRAEKVAMIALASYESGSFAYNINHYPEPGRPGQGTRAMLMYNFIYKYAMDLYPDEVKQLSAQGTDSDSDDIKNEVRALVLNNNDSFASSSWFLVKVAPQFHDSGKLKDHNPDPFADYCKEAVGADWNEGRLEVWTAVDQAL